MCKKVGSIRIIKCYKTLKLKCVCLCTYSEEVIFIRKHIFNANVLNVIRGYDDENVDDYN